ncbi:hypothetical protein GCM10011579_009370 [Streptomyces albiflavescens]|uniref:Uncharacterized protein n=1 Tax=Streptomyces albiflavescens TaxID=1623582 RepID=A0A917XUX2_9ACTN|nr:hypothetical protein GCM10011579_009370 [Streptomyces albiflavescens]
MLRVAIPWRLSDPAHRDVRLPGFRAAEGTDRRSEVWRPRVGRSRFGSIGWRLPLPADGHIPARAAYTDVHRSAHDHIDPWVAGQLAMFDPWIKDQLVAFVHPGDSGQRHVSNDVHHSIREHSDRQDEGHRR